jgi:hypothetical protein
MAVLKYYDGSDWEPVVSALQGPTGPTGAASTITGPTGATGSDASSGLVLINTTSFSGVASQAISNVFSTTYKNYLCTIFFTCAGSVSATMRLRVSGADNTTSNYSHTRFSSLSNNTTAQVSGENESSFNFFGSGPTLLNATLMVQNPFETALTTYTMEQVTFVATGGSYAVKRTAAGVFNATTSFTGFNLIGTGNIAGSISVYGVNI